MKIDEYILEINVSKKVQKRVDLMIKKIENWASAKYYSIKTKEFAFAFVFLGLAVFICLMIIFLPPDPMSILMVLPAGMCIIAFFFIFGMALRDIPRTNNWLYKEYPTDLVLSLEKNKEQLIKIIGRGLKDKNYELSEVPYKGRFPTLLIKSFSINNKIQLDICTIFDNLENRYWIVLFLGPMDDKNLSLSNDIKKSLDIILAKNIK